MPVTGGKVCRPAAVHTTVIHHKGPATLYPHASAPCLQIYVGSVCRIGNLGSAGMKVGTVVYKSAVDFKKVTDLYIAVFVDVSVVGDLHIVRVLVLIRGKNQCGVCRNPEQCRLMDIVVVNRDAVSVQIDDLFAYNIAPVRIVIRGYPDVDVFCEDDGVRTILGKVLLQHVCVAGAKLHRRHDRRIGLGRTLHQGKHYSERQKDAQKECFLVFHHVSFPFSRNSCSAFSYSIFTAQGLCGVVTYLAKNMSTISL